jgi:hypothetical protein
MSLKGSHSLVVPVMSQPAIKIVIRKIGTGGATDPVTGETAGGIETVGETVIADGIAVARAVAGAGAPVDQPVQRASLG